MRNMPSALMCIAFIYFLSTGFHWASLVLLAGAVMFWEYPIKENIELARAQIEEIKARTENIRWSTKLSESQVKVNLMMIAKARNR